MKYFCFLLFVSLAACSTSKNTGANSGVLNGIWIPVKQEIGGKQLPQAAFATQKLTISDSLYSFLAESLDKGVVKYSDGKMDIYGQEGVNKGKHFAAIYKQENGGLTVCYNLLGTHYPEAFDTNGKPMYFLSVFRKQ